MLFSMSYVQAVSGMLYLEVLVLQGQVHDRFQEWRKAGVFKQMWIDGLAMYDKKTGIDWKWQAMDWCYYKSTSWGKKAQDQIPQTELNQVQNVVFW